MSLAASPIRFPDVASRTVMTRRAWWLVVLNVLIPGSVQVLAGDRKLGRFGLGATLTLWFLALAALVVWIFWPAVIYTVFSTTITLWVVAALLAFYAVLWMILTFDTLRLVRLVKTAPSARAWVAALSVALMVAISGTAAYGAYVATTASGFPPRCSWQDRASRRSTAATTSSCSAAMRGPTATASGPTASPS